MSVNGTTQLMFKYVRDLLGQPEPDVMTLGRENAPRGNTNDLQIVVDTLAPAQILGDSSTFDGVAESMQFSALYQSVMTVDFYGNGAYAEAVRFIGLNRSQAAADLKHDLCIDVGVPSQIQDLKYLSGKQYSERYQVELTLTHSFVTDVATKRIDTAQLADPLLVNY